MHGSADGVPRNVRKIQSLSEYALSSECAVTMHQQWQELLDATLACAILLGASSADGHRVNRFQMTRIRNQMNMEFSAAARCLFAAPAQVIFHVTAAQYAAGVHIFKTSENFFRRALGDVRHHVQASAMAHAHDQFNCAVLSRAIENFINQRNERGDALE